jgi:hypothetical protein
MIAKDPFVKCRLQLEQGLCSHQSVYRTARHSRTCCDCFPRLCQVGSVYKSSSVRACTFANWLLGSTCVHWQGWKLETRAQAGQKPERLTVPSIVRYI